MLSYYQKYRVIFCFLLFFVWSNSLRSQLTVDNGVTAADAVQNTLLGTGIDVSNIVFLGDGNQVGSFDGTDSNLGLTSGVIIGSGDVANAIGPNNTSSSSLGGGNSGAGDTDLSILNPSFTFNDAAVLEFDFVATGDSMMFNYVWASEEYPEYVNSSYNDSFGFFLSGPGINGPYSNNAENIAIIPGTSSAVTIDNVNNGNSGTGGPCVNCEYYIHNGTGGAPQNSDSWYIQYDGFTTVLTAQAIVQCGETYHIKIAVADAGDTGFDSAVFLESGSFASNQVIVDLTIPAISVDDSTMYEGCGIANLIFTRNEGNPAPQTLILEVSGSAENGIDYSLIPDSIFFAENEYEITLPLEIFEDFNFEGIESLFLSISNVQTCGLSSLGGLEVYIADVVPLSANFINPTINCDETTTLSIDVLGGFGLYEIEWQDGTIGPNLEVSPGESENYYFTVSDTCSIAQYSDTIQVTIPDYPSITVDLGPDQELGCQSNLFVDPTIEGGYGDYTFEWIVQDTVFNTPGAATIFVETEGEVFLTIIDQCGESGQGSMVFSFPEVELIVDLGEDLDVLCTDLNSLNANVEGGVGNYFYSWQIDGEEIDNDSILEIQIDDETVITLIVTDECENIDEDIIILSVPAVPLSVDLGEDIDVLCTDMTDLTSEIEGGVGNYTYSWQNGNEILGTDDILSFQTDVETSITLIVNDECGNSNDDEIIISVPAVPITVDLGIDISVTCIEVNNIIADISGGVSPYNWYWEIDGSFQGEETSLDIITDEDIIVILTIIDQCGNQSEDELNITVPPVPISVVFPEDLIVNCMDTSYLEADIAGGVGSYSYSWNNEGQIIGSDIDIEVITEQSTEVVLTIEDECGNIGYGQINLIVPAIPITIQMPEDTTVCVGNDFSFTASATGGLGNFNYYWSPPISGSPVISETPQETTTYSVLVSDQCGNSSQESATVFVEDVFADFDFSYEGDWGLQMYNTSENAIAYEWDFGNQEFSYMTNPSHSYYDNYEHQITLYAEGELGCIDSITHWFVPMMDVFVPSSFTPNNDGINDVFRIKGHDVFTFEFWVFDRWGEILFYSQDINEIWDGSINNGAYYIQDGVYQYMVKAVGIRENSIEKIGTITVYR